MHADQTAAVFDYHRRTKHRFDGYARGPGGLDWRSQPDPFLRYASYETVTLPKPGALPPAAYADLDHPQTIAPLPLTMDSLGLLLELSFGLSAWKQYGDNRWALRCNPSSGNLHPTEAYLIVSGDGPVEPGVFHYAPRDHLLERRCRFAEPVQNSAVFVGLTSIHWREAWKYGERAFRYCQHDVGHALGALRYAAAVLGWTVELMAGWSDEDVERLLGIADPARQEIDEGESPDIVCRIGFGEEDDGSPPKLEPLLEAAGVASWQGSAGRLSRYHKHRWPVIDAVERAARKPRTMETFDQPPSGRRNIESRTGEPAAAIIRRRRSAQRFGGRMDLPEADFYRMLDALLPDKPVPFDLWRWPAKVNLFLFVHRVEKLEPGLYVLLRNDALDALKQAVHPDFEWRRVHAGLPLYRLYTGDCRRLAEMLSCQQPIAGDGFFSLGMVAEFSSVIKPAPWRYRRLFWECGLIGQALYLEAEAAGVRGTGIGCYFDDGVHEVLGIKDDAFQSLYHFTIGEPLEDTRLQTLPSYRHLGDRPDPDQ